MLSLTSANFWVFGSNYRKKNVLFALVLFQDFVQIYCFVWFRRLVTLVQFRSHCLWLKLMLGLGCDKISVARRQPPRIIQQK